MRTLSLAALIPVLLCVFRLPAAEEAAALRMQQDLEYLSSDKCEGRGVATKGINQAADYIAEEFKKAGLKPGNGDKGYFQQFTIAGGTLEGKPTLILHGPQGQTIELSAGEHFEALGMSYPGKLTDVPLVFAGYGITSTKDPGYDDYKDLDAAGKIVVLLRETPRLENKYAPSAADRRRFSSETEKLANAEKHKAAAVLFVNDRVTAKSEDGLMSFAVTATSPGVAKLPAMHVRRSVVDTLLKSACDRKLSELEEDIDRDLTPRSQTLTGWSADLEVKIRRTLDVKNVVGVLEGKGPLADQTVILGAHYDHLGYGGRGSLAASKKPAIHHGADDNGSGTTVLLELARRFGKMQDREGRRLVFICFTGEEMGLFGSVHYCKNPIFPLADTVAMVNLDMVGRLSPDKDSQKDKLIVYGTGSAKTFDDLIEAMNKKYDFKLQKVKSGTGPSDHASFYAKQIPVFFFFTGDHPDYHKPTDTVDKINFAGMQRIADLTEEVLSHLTHVPQRPEYQKVAGGSSSPGGPQGPKLGIRPSYGEEDDGVHISGVTEGGPAEKAGLKEGDRIVELGGKEVKNLQGYMTLMSNFKKGESLELGVIRDGKKMNVKVIPE